MNFAKIIFIVSFGFSFSLNAAEVVGNEAAVLAGILTDSDLMSKIESSFSEELPNTRLSLQYVKWMGRMGGQHVGYFETKFVLGYSNFLLGGGLPAKVCVARVTARRYIDGEKPEEKTMESTCEPFPGELP